MSKLFEQLNATGWCEIKMSTIDDSRLINIAELFGKVVLHPNGKRIDELIPKDRQSAAKNTFSFNFEFNEFPLHTDTAFWNIPAKYVLMSCSNSESATTLVNFHDLTLLCSKIEMRILEKAIFLIKTNNQNFYSRLINNNGGDPFFRFDLNCMLPVNKNAKVANDIIKEKMNQLELTRIEWNTPKVLVIDNWKIIHGREAIINHNRILKRIYINKYELE